MLEDDVNFHRNAALPTFVYGDGKRSQAPKSKRLNHDHDSAVRALATALDKPYADIVQLIEYEYHETQLNERGVPRDWMARYLEHAGYKKRPQPADHIPLTTVMALLGPTHDVILELNHRDYAALIDGVLYDLEDWRDNQSTYVTGYWLRREQEVRLRGELSSCIRDPDGEVVKDFTHIKVDELVRDPLAFGAYAFGIRGLASTWLPDPYGKFSFHCGFYQTLPRHAEKILVEADAFWCTPRYLEGLDPTRARSDIVSKPLRIADRDGLLADARRYLSSYEVATSVSPNSDAVRMDNGIEYVTASGHIIDHRRQRVLAERGYWGLRKLLRSRRSFRH